MLHSLSASMLHPPPRSSLDGHANIMGGQFCNKPDIQSGIAHVRTTTAGLPYNPCATRS